MSSDITKHTIPLPFMLTVIGLAIGAAGGVWRIDSRVSVIATTIEYEKEFDRRREADAKEDKARQEEDERQRERYLDARFAELKALIDASSMRNANMALATENAKLKGR